MSDAHPVSILIQIVKHDKYYFAKTIDWFTTRLPEAHQKGLLSFIVDQVSNERWEKRLDDPYQWIELVKSILFHYSGRENIKSEPSREELATLIGDYLDSKEFMNADIEAENVGKEDKPGFAEMMGAIDD